jgi:GAF domain-containing protein
MAQRGISSVRVGDTLPLVGSLSGLVVQTREVVFSGEVAADRRNCLREQDAAVGLRTYLGLPIRVPDGVRGVLTFSSLTPHEYGAEEATYLGALADHMAVTVQKAWPYEELEGAHVTQRERRRS